MTAREMVRVQSKDGGQQAFARSESLRAARMERATLGLVGGTRNLAFDDRRLGLQSLLPIRNHGDRGQQRARVGMRRRFEQGPDRTDLDEAAEIENADA